MANINIGATAFSNELQELINCDEIQPGDDVSYQMCKTIYSYHPLGRKIVDFPLLMAQSQARQISVPKGPEERLKEAFEREWLAIGADKAIKALGSVGRRYGVGSLALLVDGTEPSEPVDYTKLADAAIAINIFDPLNTAGSLVLNQNPNSLDFMKVRDISVQGQAYHRSRTVTLLCGDPIYIDYTVSAFGYVGRSVYQSALYPLKSFLNTMTTDDMIALKAGVLIAKQEQQSSAFDKVMAGISGIKRNLLKQARTGNVLTIGVTEEIASLDLKNMEGPYTAARKNIIENIASAAGEPAKIILAETFAEGFGEGTEDAKHIAQHIKSVREWLEPAYAFFNKLVMYRAWNPAFYKTIQNDFPEEYGERGYTEAFYDWSNSFKAVWPSLLEEPDSEKVTVNDVQLKAVIAMMEVLLPQADPANKATIILWACDNFNALKMLFGTPLDLDYDALSAYFEEEARKTALEGGAGGGTEGVDKTPKPPKPFADSEGRVKGALASFSEAVARLPARAARDVRTKQ